MHTLKPLANLVTLFAKRTDVHPRQRRDLDILTLAASNTLFVNSSSYTNLFSRKNTCVMSMFHDQDFGVTVDFG